mmetsp:Transcript_13855/g.27614  ORF Transcript_13855/g.27614 Transcript_13855/m.27614 type:complete len:121 (+) Transcript_13855:151-513(+)
MQRHEGEQTEHNEGPSGSSKGRLRSAPHDKKRNTDGKEDRIGHLYCQSSRYVKKQNFLSFIHPLFQQLTLYLTKVHFMLCHAFLTFTDRASREKSRRRKSRREKKMDARAISKINAKRAK